jgi:hypothetical protein
MAYCKHFFAGVQVCYLCLHSNRNDGFDSGKPRHAGGNNKKGEFMHTC